MSIIKVYHGTNFSFSKIDLTKSRDKRDFGKGFYVTTIYEQALKWAQNTYIRYGGDKPIVKMFEYNDDISDLKKLCFDNMNREWLEFVKENRTKGGVYHQYDIVSGPVANDNTMRTIALYISGIYTVDMALDKLRFFKTNNQISFHTEKSLSALVLKKDTEVSLDA